MPWVNLSDSHYGHYSHVKRWRTTYERVKQIPHRAFGPVRNDNRVYPLVVKASVSSVFCSTSCALALPVAGLALELRFTDITGLSPAILYKRSSMLKSAPMLAGSSCTQTISPVEPWRSNSAARSFSGNGYICSRNTMAVVVSLLFLRSTCSSWPIFPVHTRMRSAWPTSVLGMTLRKLGRVKSSMDDEASGWRSMLLGVKTISGLRQWRNPWRRSK